MAVANRIKGQECYLILKVDGILQTTIDTIQEVEIEFEQTLIEEGYLGETADRVDSVFNLCRVNVKGHANSADYLLLADSIVGRSQNRSSAPVRIDIVASFAFPNGDFPSLALIDVYFENIPFTVGGRDEHISFELTGKCSNYKIL